LNYTNSSDVGSIGSLGISINNDGTISLDVASLDSLLNSDFSGVTGFFQNSDSWGQAFSTMLTDAGTSSTTGILALASTSNSRDHDLRATGESDRGAEQRQRDHAGTAHAVNRGQRALLGDHRL